VSYNLKDTDRELIDKEARRAWFRFLGPLSKKHNIVVHISKSLIRMEVFRELARKLILINNLTR
jgi:hypothetical protein